MVSVLVPLAIACPKYPGANEETTKGWNGRVKQRLHSAKKATGCDDRRRDDLAAEGTTWIMDERWNAEPEVLRCLRLSCARSVGVSFSGCLSVRNQFQVPRQTVSSDERTTDMNVFPIESIIVDVPKPSKEKKVQT